MAAPGWLTPERERLVPLMLEAYSLCVQAHQHQPTSPGKVHCPGQFDGIGCWPVTAPGESAAVSCPDYSRNNQGKALRFCNVNGEWDGGGITGANYSGCSLQYSEVETLSGVFGGITKTEWSSSDVDAPTISPVEQLFMRRREECMEEMQRLPPPEEGLFCPRTFDGWSCWNDTPAGNTALTNCPYFITGFDTSRYAHKLCTENGTWFRHPISGQPWSNYTTCVDLDDLKIRQFIIALYISGYSISLIALCISLAIFFYFKSLKCPRITIHKNLFLSFVVNNAMWIAWYQEVAGKPAIVLRNGVGCQVLHVVLHYFLVANYFWMFCEGLYLHTLLVVAFVKESCLLRSFYILGWGFPALLTTVYTAVRASHPEETLHCWIDESHFTWILSAPVCLSLLANLVFLVNIVRLLVTKLRAQTNPEANGPRKAVRATLILIPLLGLHYILTPFRPDPGSNGEVVYQVVSAIAASFQGFCVAFLFCFLNHEVHLAIRAFVKKRFPSNYLMTSVGNNQESCV